MDSLPTPLNPPRVRNPGGGGRARLEGDVYTLPLAGDPDLLALHRLNPDRYPFLLESVLRAGQYGRFDILFAFPGATVERRTLHTGSAPFLESLDAAWRAERSERIASDHLPFRGGWFVYLGYELAGEVEPRLYSAALPRTALPIARATRIPAAVIRDHVTGSSYLAAESRNPELLDAMREDLDASLRPETRTLGGDALLSGPMIADPAEDYIAGIERIQRYIREGDVFQVNLSRAWRGRLRARVSAADIYARLRRRNPGNFAGLARFDSGAVVSSSPERLVRVRGPWVETRPIAGTYARVIGPERDRARSRALLRHPKERAEHVMLIDLERNDLGRICTAGSIEVNEFMKLESYAHVHHIVSNVRGRLRGEVSPGQVIRAVFPGGTITGCPKVRCMEIIAELEQHAREAYTGSFGYLNRDGSLDLNILIRTVQQHGNEVTFRAGAGIVADSVPSRELAETEAKARGPLAAFEALSPSA